MRATMLRALERARTGRAQSPFVQRAPPGSRDARAVVYESPAGTPLEGATLELPPAEVVRFLKRLARRGGRARGGR